MFLDVKDQWPPVPPPSPLPSPGKPRTRLRSDRMVAVIVALNLLLLLVGPVIGSAFIQTVAAIVAALHR